MVGVQTAKCRLEVCRCNGDEKWTRTCQRISAHQRQNSILLDNVYYRMIANNITIQEIELALNSIVQVHDLHVDNSIHDRSKRCVQYTCIKNVVSHHGRDWLLLSHQISK